MTEIMFIDGNDKALETVIDYYTPLVVTVISNMSKGFLSREDIEEVASDSFSALWFSRSKIEKGCLKALLLSITKNKTRDRLRKKKDIVFLSIDDECNENDFWSDGGYCVGDEMERKEVSEKLAEAVGRLDKMDSEIIIRYYYYYQTTLVISQKMGLNHKTVQTRLARARKRLKEILSEMGVGL